VLAAENFICTDWYTDAGRDRGTIVHEITHLHDIGELIEDELVPEYLPRLTAYKKFLKDTGFKVLHSEVPRYHKTHRYAGTPDKVGEFGKYMAVIDLKSGDSKPWHSIQTAGQAELVKDNLSVILVKRFGLQLKTDGTYRLTEHYNRQDAGIWMACLSCFNWKRNHRR
jgi:hypothetical protein